MKHAIYLLFLLFVTASCKKNNDVMPSGADKIAGTYTVYNVISGQNSINLPIVNGSTTISAIITVTKKTDSSVGVVITQRTTGTSDANTDLGTLDIKGTDLYAGTSKFGSADGTNFNLDITSNGSRSAFFSKR